MVDEMAEAGMFHFSLLLSYYVYKKPAQELILGDNSVRHAELT